MRERDRRLLKRDADYETVFNRNYPIPLYLVCANLMKLIDREVHADKHALDRKDQTNVRFYAAMYLASLATGKPVPTRDEIAAISLSSITDAMLTESVKRVYELYKNLGASDQVAKGVDLLEQLKSELEREFTSVR